jgi:pyocin large subunit-like protein
VEHFQKHGAEFGRISVDEYLRAAQTLRDRPAGGDILESVRADGVVTRFDRGSGAFLACDRDGVIRTFFRPNDGEAYFQRQLKRGHSVP